MSPMSDQDPDLDLPRGVALAWGVAASPQRGPKRELSVERIVDAAIAIADEGGLGAVSMASVSSALGFTTMSLYRYVSAKDDLVLLMQEQGIGVPPESIRETEGWRAGLTAWADAQVELYREHPWMLDIPIQGTPVTPNNLAWLDSALEVLDDAPLTDDERSWVTLAVIAQVRWRSTIERGYTVAAREGLAPESLDHRGIRILEAFVTEADLPFVARALAAGSFSPDADGDPFAFGLERVLDGVAQYLEGRPAAVRPAEPYDPLIEEAARDPRVREAVKARREVEKRLREARKRERELLAAARGRLGSAR
jgi:AcrR family transcriptional regulator